MCRPGHEFSFGVGMKSHALHQGCLFCHEYTYIYLYSPVVSLTGAMRYEKKSVCAVETYDTVPVTGTGGLLVAPGKVQIEAGYAIVIAGLDQTGE